MVTQSHDYSDRIHYWKVERYSSQNWPTRGWHELYKLYHLCLLRTNAMMAPRTTPAAITMVETTTGVEYRGLRSEGSASSAGSILGGVAFLAGGIAFFCIPTNAQDPMFTIHTRNTIGRDGSVKVIRKRPFSIWILWAQNNIIYRLHKMRLYAQSLLPRAVSFPCMYTWHMDAYVLYLCKSLAKAQSREMTFSCGTKSTMQVDRKGATILPLYPNIL